jgi:hypothetical protein
LNRIIHLLGPELHRQGASFLEAVSRACRMLLIEDLGVKSAAPLPVEEPTKFEFVTNLKIAKALRIPPSVLLRTDQVID